MSNDPVGFTGNPHRFNRYAYANNNPYKYIDPDGKLPIIPLIIAGGRACIANSTCRTSVILGLSINKAINSLDNYFSEGPAVQDQYLDMNESFKKGDYKNAFKQQAQANQDFKDLTKTALKTAKTVASSIPGTTISGPTPLTKTEQAIAIGLTANDLIDYSLKNEKEGEKNEGENILKPKSSFKYVDCGHSCRFNDIR